MTGIELLLDLHQQLQGAVELGSAISRVRQQPHVDTLFHEGLVSMAEQAGGSEDQGVKKKVEALREWEDRSSKDTRESVLVLFERYSIKRDAFLFLAASRWNPVENGINEAAQSPPASGPAKVPLTSSLVPASA